jgi:hypothetical protein
MEQKMPPEDSHIHVGRLIRYEARHPHSGVMALTLQQANGSEMEVLVDAESTLQHLASVFGSVNAAVGQEVVLSQDVFGFSWVRGLSFSVKLGRGHCLACRHEGLDSD